MPQECLVPLTKTEVLLGLDPQLDQNYQEVPGTLLKAAQPHRASPFPLRESSEIRSAVSTETPKPPDAAPT